jgi:phosphoribosylaminoimidazolecarboxamide formyltransferase/IMP cyclohydrolase
VFDKSGIVEFATALQSMGVELISSGGTAKALHQAGVKVRQLSEWTGFPEMLGHRVVTLHPKVHGAILALRDDAAHLADMQRYGIEPIDLVCVGLYPFESVIGKPDTTFEQAVEMIDIGGPTMVRAAAKNHKFVAVLTHATQYAQVLAEMRAKDGCVSKETRSSLARSAFAYTASYDAAISRYLNAQAKVEFPEPGLHQGGRAALRRKPPPAGRLLRRLRRLRTLHSPGQAAGRQGDFLQQLLRRQRGAGTGQGV